MKLRWLGMAWLLACAGQDDVRIAEDITGGNVARGKLAFRKYGCGTCHEVHGEQRARGGAGPSFHDFALQSYLPGGLTNSPTSLMSWIQNPREVSPSTAMPDLDVSLADARDLAAYLYTMR